MMTAKEKHVTVHSDELVVTRLGAGTLFVSLGVHSNTDELLDVTIVRDMQKLTGKIKLQTLADALARALAEEELHGPKG